MARIGSFAACAVVILSGQPIVAGVRAQPAMAQEKSPAAASPERREVTAVVPRSWPPLYSVDENDRPVGFAIDVMDAVAERAGVKVAYLVAKNFPEAMRLFDEGSAGLIPNIGITAERQRNSTFTSSVATFFLSIVVRADMIGINGLDDLAGRNVGVVYKSVGETFLKDRKDINSIVHRDVQSVLFNLLAGQVDAVVFPKAVLTSLARQIGIENRIKVVGAPLLEVKCSIRIHNRSPELGARLGRVAKDFVDTPEYQAIYLKWFGTPRPFWTVAGISWAMGALLLAVLIAMAWWRYYSVLRLNRNLRQTIAELRLAENALRESEGRFGSALQAGGVGMFVREIGGPVIEVNSALAGFLGYAEHELLGKTIFDFTPEEDAAGTRERMCAVDSGERSGVRQVERRYLRKDGGEVWGLANTEVVRGANGEPRYVVGNIQDITERKRAETALRDSEARYRDLIEGSELGIQIATEERGRIFTNRACVELFGYDSAEDLFSAPHCGLVAEYDRERVIQIRDAMLAGQAGARCYEFDGLRKDGSIIPLQAFMRPIVWNGEIAHQRTFIDLTERKRAEAQLRQAQKMEAVGQLTGGVAHDFNNLLTVVHGNLELIAARLEDPALARMAESAINASRRGGELTQRLLAFSRRQTLAPEAIDPDELVGGMTEFMRRTLGETIEIEIATGEDTWRCEADPGQLENAILNLALNARDAMPQGGGLTIETANVNLDDADVAARNEVLPGEYVMVAIADTGTGMSREVLDHVFEPFFTTKEVGEGSGLGLSMVHGFINQSRGYVTIDSTVGAGTTVKMYVPRALGTCRPAERFPDAEEPASHGERVLVVEDDPAVRVLSVNMLADLGYDTIEAADGKQALEILKGAPAIDLLFTDVVLPGGMSGADIAREATRRYPDIKILFTSGYADDVLARFGETDAGVHLINKPFRRHDLAQQVRVALNQPPS